ncbi:UNKNOWN [Stylonychia lemnae]|uniref:Uncharacterized protein n=1 Tax=Stylonychia lemnae TaxID=5949 RepID=A0A078B6N5_STYLE|nr:UNKNOWN [Stylonychia lemnae]|eukprot:CDW88947.1 UNKNOWN [Stylonychia lemnae]
MKVLKIVSICTIALASQLSNAQLLLPNGAELQGLLNYAVHNPQVVYYPNVEKTHYKNSGTIPRIAPQEKYSHTTIIETPMVMGPSPGDTIGKIKSAVDTALLRQWNYDQSRFLGDLKSECIRTQVMMISANKLVSVFSQRFEKIVASNTAVINSDQYLKLLVNKIRTLVKQSNAVISVQTPIMINNYPIQFRPQYGNIIPAYDY